MSQEEYIKQLETTIKSLENQVANLTELILGFQKKQFGSSSEKTKREDFDGQLNLFNEPEVEYSENIKEPTRIESHTRAKKQKGHKEELLKNLEVIEINCELHENERSCPWCNTQMKPIGKETVREEVQYIPAQLKVLRYIRYAYECPACRKDGTPVVVKAYVPEPVMKHSLASASTVAHVMYQKYVNALPLYRQEKEWEQLGVAISRATLANWMICSSRSWFVPLIEYMRTELLTREVLHADETTVQVLKEEGKAPTSTSYMWLYRTGNWDNKPIVIFDYKSSRSGTHPHDYLNGFHGFLHTDGYGGYEKVDGIIRCGCWADLRRKFVDAMPPGAEKLINPCTAEIGKEYCDQLFKLEKEFAEFPYEERRKMRLEKEKPILEAFWCWQETITALKNSKLNKAITYAWNQKKNLENFLLDGRCSLSNNLAENSIRPFCIGRKNWLFSESTKGAQASAAIYSIIETAKANGINPMHYLQYILTYMPMADFNNNPAILESMMPWSKDYQEFIK